MKKKKMTLLIAMTVILSVIVGSTVAYLMDKTGEVKNTFTVGDIDIDLVEKDGVEDGTWQKQMVPGTTYGKDPTVSVDDTKTNVDCWLFVAADLSEKAGTYLSFDLTLDDEDSGWTKGDGTNIPENVWYREVLKEDTTKSWKLLNGNEAYPDGCVTVKPDTVTKETMTEAAAQYLSFTAYAAQSANLTAQEAWAVLNPTT